MVTALKRCAFVLLLLSGSPAFAGASNFILVNGTGSAMADVSITRSGAKDWAPLGASAAAGARSPVKFSNQDCAFDIRANVAGSQVTWAGVNLCDVKSVVLKRDGSAGAWVDYDQ
ncbi:MAG: hypothetical protein HOP95_12850 [Sphingomonas sp.]|nr:hypothetical protein [Sphingomonas sp.]